MFHPCLEVDLGDPFHHYPMHTFPPVGDTPLSPLSPLMNNSRPLPQAIRPNIPYDVLRCIFEYLSPEELLDVALVSRYFQSVALHALIGTHTHYSRGEDVVWSHPTDVTLLRALCRLKWEIPTLVYTFRHSITDATFVEEVAQLRRFLVYMQAKSPNEPCPRQIILDLCNVTPALSLNLHGRKCNEKRWAGPLAGLFDDIILFTQSLTVRCGRPLRPLSRNDISRAAKHLGLGELHHHHSHPASAPLGWMGLVRSSLLNCLPHMFDYGPGQRNKGMQELPFSLDHDDLRRSADVRPALMGPGPKVLNINSSLFFHPALLRWTLELLSSRCKDLEHLSFKYVGISRGCWAELFPHIQAPNLTSFHLDQCSFPTLDVAKFVARNRQLETLRLGPNILGTHKEDDGSPSWLKLPKVVSMGATPGCLSRLLFGPDSSVAPELKEATLFVRVSREEEGAMADLDRKLSLIQDRLSEGVELTLQLVMETRSVGWFRSQTGVDGDSSRPPIRHSITHLRICADIHRLPSDFWEYLPTWISEFLPGVTSVNMVERQGDCSHECGDYIMQLDVKRSRDIQVLVDGLRRSCTNVRELQVGDVTGRLEDWFRPVRW